MEEFGVFLKEDVRMEGKFFVEMIDGRVATIDIMVLEGTNFTVIGVFLKELGVGLGSGLIVFDQPDVGILCFFENILRTIGNGSVARDIGKDIVGTSITEELSGSALARGNIPRTSIFQVAEDSRTLEGVGTSLPYPILQLKIIGFDRREDTIGKVGFSQEKSIEAHPFGTGKRVDLHIVGTLDDRDIILRKPTIPTAILVGRHKDSIRGEGYHLFYIRRGRRTEVLDSARGETTLNIILNHILGVEDAFYGIHGVEFGEESHVDGGLYDGIGEGDTKDVAFGKLGGGWG